MKTFKILVDGQLKDSDIKMDINNPTTNEVAGQVPLFDAKQIVELAMNSASEAFKTWGSLSFDERKQYLDKFIQLMREHKEELADLLVLEIAKSKKESLIEIERSIEYIDDTIKIYYDLITNPLIIDESVHKIKGKVGRFIREPLGVVLAIPPFNYPVNLLVSKLAPALIAGNTVVYKPATQGSLVGARISELFALANFPRGVINCVTGQGRQIGDFLVTNKNVAMISFTGSANVGNHIADLVKRIPLVLEMGGKDPAIVLDDADLELAASEIVKGGLSYNGQRCTAIKRVFAVDSIYDELVEKITHKVKQLTVGNPDDSPNITPVISNSSAKYIMELVDDALRQGAINTTEIITNQNLIHPIVLKNVTVQMRVAWEEPFGPVLPIIKVKDWQTAVALSNESEYGLQSSIFTQNIKLAEDIALLLECGSVNINRSSARGPDFFPFLGVKNSGFGTQGLLEAILSMTKIKGIVYNK